MAEHELYGAQGLTIEQYDRIWRRGYEDGYEVGYDRGLEDGAQATFSNYSKSQKRRLSEQQLQHLHE